MGESNQKVPFTVANVNKCICVQCPVQTASQCIRDKKDRMKGTLARIESGTLPEPDDLPGLYCATGVAACEDIDTTQMCICGDCPLWDEYTLLSGKPLGYYCRKGKSMD